MVQALGCTALINVKDSMLYAIEHANKLTNKKLMADVKNEDHFENPINKQSDNPPDEFIPNNDTETIKLKKNWKYGSTSSLT